MSEKYKIIAISISIFSLLFIFFTLLILVPIYSAFSEFLSAFEYVDTCDEEICKHPPYNVEFSEYDDYYQTYTNYTNGTNDVIATLKLDPLYEDHNGYELYEFGYNLTEVSIVVDSRTYTRSGPINYYFECTLTGNCIIIEEIEDGIWQLGETLILKENGEKIVPELTDHVIIIIRLTDSGQLTFCSTSDPCNEGEIVCNFVDTCSIIEREENATSSEN